MIGVTGTTGKLGGRIAALVARAGRSQALIGRDPSRIPELTLAQRRGPAAYDDVAGMRRALDGVSALVLVSGALSGRRLAEHVSVIDAAAAAGVEQVVYVSLMGAAPAATYLNARDHWQTERYLAGSGLRHTVLRPCYYASMLPGLAVDGVIRGPAAEGRVAAVAHDDLAEVAAAVVLTPDGRHDGAVLAVTGPAALTLVEVAEQVALATGRSCRYAPESAEEAFAWRLAAAPTVDGPLVDGWVSWYLAIAAGELGTVTDVVPRLTGHAARTVAATLGTARPRDR